MDTVTSSQPVTTSTGTIRIVLVDDHTILRQGIRRIFESDPAIQVVGEAKDGREAIDVVRSDRPDVIVMDLSMPALNGLDATRRILKIQPDARILILTMYLDDDYVNQSLEAGVSGYILKDAPAHDLIRAVKQVASGEGYFTSRIPASTIARYRAARAEDRERTVDLTRREREVLKLLAEGHTVKKVAEVMSLSQKTVDTHKTNLMKKLDIHNRVELVKYAIQQKIIQV